ncbi:MAG: hypothetical protein Q4F18_03510 [Clostridia bacterium]|nr:hypothetical protein [Clostridia bacterium]
MSLKKRILALATSAALLAAPTASLAEGITFAAGDLTKTAISDSYIGGQQINLNLKLQAEAQNTDSAQMQALTSLIGKSEINVSFYDDFGTARVRGDLSVDGVKLLTADVMIYEDGSVQLMTNLTGKYVLAMPEGTFVNGRLNLDKISGASVIDLEEDDISGLSARERLSITAADINSLLIQHLLGWVSYTQMETGDLYVFDDTYIEETDTRDAVAQRMIGTIAADVFNSLLWNISATICDECGEFQQAVADVLAEMGITRQQVRQAVDRLFTQEAIDPAMDFVQTTYAVMQGDPDALCEYDDVSYFFKKLVKCTDYIWEESTENTMHMIVSYDDNGGMVGFDADAPKFSEVLPYEGFFNYSIKTDDDWQRLHTAHGELQIYDDNRVVGDLNIQFGEDVDGENVSFLNGQLDVVNQVSGASMGVGVTSQLEYKINDEGSVETISADANVLMRDNGSDSSIIGAKAEGVTTLTGDGFAIEGEISAELPGLIAMSATVTLESVEYEETDFAGGQAIDLANLDDEQLETIKGEVIAQVAKLSPSLILHPGVLADVMTLMGGN